MSKQKKFDAVKMMRNIREKMNASYLENPLAFKKDLELINEKFGIKKRTKKLKKAGKTTG